MDKRNQGLCIQARNVPSDNIVWEHCKRMLDEYKRVKPGVPPVVVLFDGSLNLTLEFIRAEAKVVFVHEDIDTAVMRCWDVALVVGEAAAVEWFLAECHGLDENVSDLIAQADIIVVNGLLHHLSDPYLFFAQVMGSGAGVAVVDTTAEYIDNLIEFEELTSSRVCPGHHDCRNGAERVGFRTVEDIAALWWEFVDPDVFKDDVLGDWCGTLDGTHVGAECWVAVWFALDGQGQGGLGWDG